MKKLNPATKHFFVSALLLLVIFLPAQRKQFLNSNNVNAGIAIGGNLFSDSIDAVGGDDLFEVPKGSGKALIFTQALWMSALDANDSLHVAANRYFDYGTDYFDGPVAANYDSAYDHYYKRVFKVTQSQITSFKSLAFPATEAQVDSAILFWPGKGNSSVASNYGVTISSPLAPFVDVNNNGVYEPLLGDYPGICGDAGVFFVFNDERAAHTQTNGKALGVEIRGLASAFIDSSTNVPFNKLALNNSIFVQYQIENKSQNNYTNFNLGNFTDPDIGCFNNDYVGCDSSRNLMFGYNGTQTDPDCAPENGYGNTSIALGIRLLNQTMNVFGYFTGQAASSPAVSDPISASAYNLFLQGYWGDTTAFEFGGTGHNSGGALTKFMFSGDPNDANGWSEPNVGDAPGDRRMFGASHAATFNIGEVKHYDYAFYGSYDTGTHSSFLKIVDTLKRDGDLLLSFYQNTILPCQNQFTTAVKEIAPELVVSIYPNPTNSQITITAGNEIKSIELMDMQGRLLLTKKVGAKLITLPVADLAKGVYLVNIQCNMGSVVKKIIVE